MPGGGVIGKGTVNLAVKKAIENKIKKEVAKEFKEYVNKSIENNSTKPANQTSSGRVTDKYGNKKGPSGKIQVNVVKHSQQKQAKDAARNEGKKAPVKHTNPTKGKDHYHATDKNGEKKHGSAHHEYN